jgi:hypothetical protein
MSYSVVIEGEDRPPMRVMLETLEQARRFLEQLRLPPRFQLTLTDADGVVIDVRTSGDPLQKDR